MASDNPLSFLHVVKPEIDLEPGTDVYAPEVYATGLTNVMDLGFGPDGTLYVAEIVHEGLMPVFMGGDVPPIGAVRFDLARPAPGGSCAYNFISVPLDRDDLIDADALAADVGGVQTVSRWNAATQDLIWRSPGGPGRRSS